MRHHAAAACACPMPLVHTHRINLWMVIVHDEAYLMAIRTMLQAECWLIQSIVLAVYRLQALNVPIPEKVASTRKFPHPLSQVVPDCFQGYVHPPVARCGAFQSMGGHIEGYTAMLLLAFPEIRTPSQCPCKESAHPSGNFSRKGSLMHADGGAVQPYGVSCHSQSNKTWQDSSTYIYPGVLLVTLIMPCKPDAVLNIRVSCGLIPQPF